MPHHDSWLASKKLATTPLLLGREITDYCGIVVGIDIDYEVMDQHASMMMVSVGGTAVQVE